MSYPPNYAALAAHMPRIEALQTWLGVEVTGHMNFTTMFALFRWYRDRR